MAITEILEPVYKEITVIIVEQREEEQVDSELLVLRNLPP